MTDDSYEVREEILSWADETDQTILRFLGQKISDNQPLGFMAARYVDDVAHITIAENWVQKHYSNLIGAFDAAKVTDSVELAVSLYDLVHSRHPEMPVGALCVVLARKIVAKQSPVELSRDHEQENGVNYQEDNNNEVADTPPLPMPSGKTPAKPGTQPDNTALGTAGTPDGNSLRFSFEGSLDRDALADALRSVLQQKNLTVRAAAALAGVTKSQIQRSLAGDATVDKSLEVLQKIGCELEFRITSEIDPEP